MKKPELLSPAGDMDTLKMAINCGADAIYVGGEKFSARAYAKNFNKEELKKAVEYSHLYDVKLYVAVNTIVFENEIEPCLNYLKYLYEIGVDAVIMQDIGMISLTKKLIPNLEIHASTQINCHNDECLKLLKKMKVKRVVLAREMDIDTINNLKTDIDKEIFIHGALCVSYSGRCLFSSLNGGRSGNRGRCTGSCRLPYELYKEGKKLKDKYPLSTKELCTVNKLDKILSSNAQSLKIEGRMKSKEYVGYVTKVYRRLIDEYYKDKKITVKKEEMINLSKLFNRDFTEGYLFNSNIYNTNSSNHLGYPLGKVTKVTDKKIFIKLSDDLNLEDGIRFVNSNRGMIVNKIYDDKNLLTNKALKNEVISVDNKIGLKHIDAVNKTIDRKLLKSIDETSQKKMDITFSLKGHIGKELTLKISDGKNEITKKSIILDRSKNVKMDKKMLKEKLSKINNTPFKIKKINIDIEDVFIPLKYLNELKHSLIDELIKKRVECKNKVNFNYKKIKTNYKSHNINVFVKNEKDIIKYRDKCNIMYTDNYELYTKFKHLNIYYRLDNIMNKFPDYKNERLLINDLGSLNRYYKNNKIITDYSLNIANSESVLFLQKYNVVLTTLSPELPNYEILKYTKNTEIIVKGKLELMILKDFHTKGKDIKIKDKFGNVFPIVNNRVLHYKNIDIKDKIYTNTRIIL